MIQWILGKLRHALRQLPDDIVYLNSSLQDMKAHIEKLECDPHGGISADSNIRYIHIIADNLRRAEQDGKLMFDIPDDKYKSIINAKERCNLPKAADNNHNSIHTGAWYCHECCMFHDKTYQENVIRCQGIEISDAIIDIVEEWNRPPGDSQYPINEAHSHLEAYSNPNTSAARQRKSLVDAAVKVIRQLDRHDKERGG